MANYSQPNTDNPGPNPQVGVMPVLNGDILGTGTTPRAQVVEAGLSDKDDPHHTIRGH